MKGADFMQLQKAERQEINARSGRFEQRIGSTTYRVSIYWGTPNPEKAEDKILRLIKNDLTTSPKCATISTLQTVRLPERSSL
jgi:hypothetical protein